MMLPLLLQTDQIPSVLYLQKLHGFDIYIKLTATLCMHCWVLLVLYYDRTTSKKQVLHDSDFGST